MENSPRPSSEDTLDYPEEEPLADIGRETLLLHHAEELHVHMNVVKMNSNAKCVHVKLTAIAALLSALVAQMVSIMKIITITSMSSLSKSPTI